MKFKNSPELDVSFPIKKNGLKNEIAKLRKLLEKLESDYYNGFNEDAPLQATAIASTIAQLLQIENASAVDYSSNEKFSINFITKQESEKE